MSPANQTQQMTLGQLLLTYGLLPVLVLTVLGIRRARRAQAGWITWLPVILYFATIVVAFLMGFANAAFGVPGGVVQAVVYVFGLASVASGIWLFVRFSPKTAEPAAAAERR